MFLLIMLLFGTTACRTINRHTIDGVIWYQGSNVCEILGITNITDAMEDVPHAEKTKIRMRTAGHEHGVWHITDKGIFFLIMHSHTDRTKAFRNLIANELLPLAATALATQPVVEPVTIE